MHSKNYIQKFRKIKYWVQSKSHRAFFDYWFQSDVSLPQGFDCDLLLQGGLISDQDERYSP
jgi:hypothetical protein